MAYKVIPFSAAVLNNQSASAVATDVERIINKETGGGWEFVGVYQLQTFKAGSSGCFGFGATQATTVTSEFVVLRQ